MLTIDSYFALIVSRTCCTSKFPSRQLYTFSTDLWGHLSEHSWRVAQVNVDEVEEREKRYVDDATILCMLSYIQQKSVEFYYVLQATSKTAPTDLNRKNVFFQKWNGGFI